MSEKLIAEVNRPVNNEIGFTLYKSVGYFLGKDIFSKLSNGGRIEIKLFANDPPKPKVTFVEGGKWIVYSTFFGRAAKINNKDIPNLDSNVNSLSQFAEFSSEEEARLVMEELKKLPYCQSTWLELLIVKEK